MPPKRSTALATAAPTESRSVTSHTTCIVSGPIRAAVSASTSGSRPASVTLAPRRADSAPTAAPMPRAPPVMKTTLPRRSICGEDNGAASALTPCRFVRDWRRHGGGASFQRGSRNRSTSTARTMIPTGPRSASTTSLKRCPTAANGPCPNVSSGEIRCPACVLSVVTV